jgi:hypothetical protein
MVTPRITRALNPHRRKLTLKQIRAGFGGKRRLASLKGSKRHAHRRPKAKASNPKKRKRRATAKAKNATRTRVVYRTKYKTRTKKVYVKAKPRRKASSKAKNPKRRRSSNPGSYLLTMSPVGNPDRKRRKSVAAKKRRKVSAKGRSGKRNPTRRRSYAKTRRMHRPRTSRNPLGVSTSEIKWVLGGAIGFTAGKKIPPLFGPSMNSSPMMSLLSTGIVAGVMTWAAKKFAPAYATGVFIGSGMAVLNVAINAWAPASLQQYSALGDFVSGGFPLPQGPVRYVTSAAPDMTPSGQQAQLGAFGRAW